MKRLILTILLLMATLVALGNTPVNTTPTQPKKGTDANILGHIVDLTSGEHIPFATVAIKGTTNG